MIQDVADFFKIQVGNSREIREASYDMFVHRIRIKSNTVAEIMAQDVIDICAEINKRNDEVILDPKIDAIKNLLQVNLEVSLIVLMQIRYLKALQM